MRQYLRHYFAIHRNLGYIFCVILALLIHFGFHNTNPTCLMLSITYIRQRRTILFCATFCGFADAVIHNVTATLVILQLLKSLNEEHKTSRIVNFCRKKKKWAASWQNQKMTVRPAKTQISLGIWVFAGRTNHFVGFVMRLKCIVGVKEGFRDESF